MERNQETEGGKGSERVPRPGQQVGVLGVHDVGGQLAAPQRIVGKSTPVGTRSGEESSSVAQKKPRLEGQPKDRTGPQVTNTGASSTAVTAAAAIGEEEQGDIEVDGKDTDVAMLLWEKQTHALLVLLSNKKMLNVDEMRRGVENLPPEVYKKVSYYGKWARSFVNILLEKGILTDSDILHHIFGQDAREESNQHQAQGEQPTPQFNVGQLVRVKKEDFRTFWIKPHLRTPGYVHNAIGVVQAYVGEFNAPNENAFWNRAKKKQHLYRITFKQSDLWIGYPLQHSAKAKDGEKREDEVLVEVFEPWLKQATSAEYEEYVKELKKLGEKLFEHHETSQQEVEEHGHSHEERQQVEEAAVKKETPSFSDEMFAAGLIKALEAKGIVTAEEIRKVIEGAETKGKVLNGARIVLKAWRDPSFKERLQENANEAVKELNLEASNPHAFTKLVCLFNEKDKVHHVIVCTLCSCYPAGLIGASPSWYKSRAYRSRVVIQPREVLEEFGTKIPQQTVVRVVDSTADCRYMVVPCPPEDLETLTEEEALKLVTRDRLIGVKQ